MGLVPLFDGSFTTAAVQETASTVEIVDTLSQSLHLLFTSLPVHVLLSLMPNVARHAASLASHTHVRTISSQFVLVLQSNHLLPFPGIHLKSSLLHLHSLHVLLVRLLILRHQLHSDRLAIWRKHCHLHALINARGTNHVGQLL